MDVFPVVSKTPVITDVNPFIYSHPLSPEDVIDRDAETEELLRNVVGGHYVRLFAPRKYGKTSLLKRALRDGDEREGLIPVLVDLYRVSSIADVTVRFERAYSKHLKGAVRSKVEEFLQRTGIGLSLGAYGISAKLQIDARFDPLPALHALLDLPLRLEESGGYRAFVALDEFQDVDKVDGLDGLIRSHIQYQGEVASYVFAGSEPGLMKQLFENKDRPLYGSAVPMRLQRLADEDIAAYVAQRFTDTGRSVLDAHADTVQYFWARFTGQPHPGLLQPEMGFVQDELNELTRTVWGGTRAAVVRGDDEAIRNVRSAIERCKNEVREIIARSVSATSSATVDPC